MRASYVTVGIDVDSRAYFTSRPVYFSPSQGFVSIFCVESILLIILVCCLVFLFCLSSFYFQFNANPAFSRVHVTRSLVLYVCFVDRCLLFCTFSFDHCVVCSSSIYGF